MKTPEEIKKGLENCTRLGGCVSCPYFVDNTMAQCTPVMAAEALAYIRELEARLVDANKTSDDLRAKLAEYEKPLAPMINDLISRSELLLEMAAGCVPLDERGISGVTGDESTIYDYIKNAPAVDAAPVAHGHYGFTGPHIGETYSPYAEHGTCSNCKSRILIDPQHKKFCPNCGARMDKEANY